jgi:hypothetical protein
LVSLANSCAIYQKVAKSGMTNWVSGINPKRLTSKHAFRLATGKRFQGVSLRCIKAVGLIRLVTYTWIGDIAHRSANYN